MGILFLFPSRATNFFCGVRFSLSPPSLCGNRMWKLRLNGESHGLSNAICDGMLRSREEEFAAYRVPHPLDDFGEVVFSAPTEEEARRRVEEACSLLVCDVGSIQREVGEVPLPQPVGTRVGLSELKEG